LLKVRRIFVESFGDDVTSKQLQAMVINALVESKRFIVTENKDKADAILKGTGLEKTSHNLSRPHSALGYRTPEEFRVQAARFNRAGVGRSNTEKVSLSLD
jgi:curli biogenesis system outer membrane secretion channel CsgG